MLPNDKSELAKAFNIGGSEYPKLGLKVLIVGNCFLSGAIQMFAKAGCTRAESIEDAELVCFLGGEDVDPQLYGEKALNGTYFNVERDKKEMDIFAKCVELSKPMFGICRGMQFLHVMNGGKLYQHVHGHAGRPHLIIDLQSGKKLLASSLHHQMCIENSTTFPLAYASVSGGRYHTQREEFTNHAHQDLEAAVYPNINAIAVQGHPEIGDIPEFSAWCLRKVEEFLSDKSMIGHNIKPQPEGVAIRDIAFLNASAKTE